MTSVRSQKLSPWPGGTFSSSRARTSAKSEQSCCLLPPTGWHGPKRTADLMILPYHSGWGAKSQQKHGHNLTPRHRLIISCTACRPTNHHVHALSCALPARRKIQYTGCCFSLTVGKVSAKTVFSHWQPGSLSSFRPDLTSIGPSK